MVHVAIAGRLRGAVDTGRVHGALWRDGALSGDPFAVAVIRAEVDRWGNATAGPPTGPFTATAAAHMRSGLTMLVLMVSVFAPGSPVETDVPAPVNPDDGLGGTVS